jgi:hypothetical protein
MPKEKFITIKVYYYLDENDHVIYDRDGLEEQLQENTDELEKNTN